MTELIELTVGELRVIDAGQRVVITRDGVTVDGVLDDITVFGRRDYKTDEYKPSISLEIVADTTTVKMQNLPLDYKLQLEPAQPEGEA